MPERIVSAIAQALDHAPYGIVIVEHHRPVPVWGHKPHHIELVHMYHVELFFTQQTAHHQMHRSPIVAAEQERVVCSNAVEQKPGIVQARAMERHCHDTMTNLTQHGSIAYL